MSSNCSANIPIDISINNDSHISGSINIPIHMPINMPLIFPSIFPLVFPLICPLICPWICLFPLIIIPLMLLLMRPWIFLFPLIHIAIFPITITGWWCNNHLETYYESQWEGLSHNYMKWKIKFMFETTNQINSPWIYPFSHWHSAIAHLTWKLTAVVGQILEKNHKWPWTC